MDGIAGFPGVVSRCCCPATGTAPGADRDDNCGCWLHTRCAGSRLLLCVAHAGSVSGLPGSEAFHRAGEQSPDPRSDRPSMLNPLLEGHSQRQERYVVEGVGEQEQTPSCGLGQDEAGAPVRVSGSGTHWAISCQHSCPQAEWLHQRSGSISWSSSESVGSKAPRCKYSSTTSRAVNARLAAGW